MCYILKDMTHLTPAEQYAIRTGQHPRKTTLENINIEDN